MKPTFKLSSKDKLFINDEFICNGHWLVRREYNKLPALEVNLKSGTHYKKTYSEHLPAIEKLVSNINLEEYHKAESFPIADSNESFEIPYYVVEDIKINSQYILICTLGDVWIKDQNSPIVIMRDDIIVALLMPMRI